MRKIVIALSLPLTGEYSPIGLQIAAALRLAATDLNSGGAFSLAGAPSEFAFEYRDDASNADRAREIYRWLCFERRADLLFGPYSTVLTAAAAEVAADAGRLLINHGGAGDDLNGAALSAADPGHGRRRLIVSVLSPASDYMTPVVRLLATLKFWRKRLAIVAAKAPFARAVAEGAERESRQRRNWLRGVR